MKKRNIVQQSPYALSRKTHIYMHMHTQVELELVKFGLVSILVVHSLFLKLLQELNEIPEDHELVVIKTFFLLS